MRVNTVNFFRVNIYNNAVKHSNISFTGVWEDEWEGEFGDDGTLNGASLRDWMRWNMYSRVIPVVDPTEDDSSEMRYANTLEDVFIKNFRKLPNTSYSGESLLHHPEFFKLLPRSGVDRIVDLRSNSEMEKACKEHNIGYVPYDTSFGYGGQSIFKDRAQLREEHSKQLIKEGATKKDYDSSMTYFEKKLDRERDIYIKKLADLVNVVNMGHFYMSCELGDYRTVNVLALASTFNPKWGGAKIRPRADYVPKLINLYKNMSEENKKTLGIDEKYDEYLKAYLEKLNNINIMRLGELPDSSYTGEYLQSFPEYVKRLHALDVNRVIDLCDNPKLKAACDNEGIEYSVFDTKLKDESAYIFEKFSEASISMASKVRHSVNSDDEYYREMALFKNKVNMERDAYVDNLAKLINIVNDGHYCISSDYGMPDTSNTLALVSIFNPKWQGQRMRPNPEYISKIINFYNNLSEENKKTLSIDEKYDEYLANYMKKLA